MLTKGSNRYAGGENQQELAPFTNHLLVRAFVYQNGQNQTLS
jgi:hypothetical protein